MQLPRRTEPENTRAWLGVALGVLVLAGTFAILLVIGRMPPFDRWITDPAFFRRALVVHVDLALVAWFHAFSAALLSTLPSRGGSGRWTAMGAPFSMAGITLWFAAAFIPGAEPVLSNYVPMIDHPLFAGGLMLFGGGVLLSFLDGRLLSAEPGWLRLADASLPFIKAGGIALGLAGLTFASSWAACPEGLDPKTRWELVNWGGGHLLQLASVCAMLATWIHLGSGVSTVMSRDSASKLATLLILPWMAAPLLTLDGVQNATYLNGFTQLMRWGIFPVASVVLVKVMLAVRGRGLGDLRVAGFTASAGLTLLGFFIGFMIRGSDTIIPGHYHASIGAVTAAFMAMTWPLMEGLGMPLPDGRLRRWAARQPLIFGVGQAVFAVGFALAGANGAMRKTYGAEQADLSFGATAGLVVMGVGGLLAVVGGLLFITLAWSARRASQASNPGDLLPATPSRR